MQETLLVAKKRELSTKGAVNQLRRDNHVPGVFYSKGSEPIAILVHENALRPLVYTAEAHLVKLEIEGASSYQSILKDVQFDPVTDRIIHFDIQGLSSDQKLELQIPVVIKGQAVGMRDGGVVQHNLHKLDIECLPADIPQHIELDITNLKVGEAIHVRDLSFDKFTIKNNADVSIVAIVIPRAHVDTAAEPGAAPAEPEVISKGKATEDEE